MEHIDERIKQKVKLIAKDGRLACAQAMDIANSEGVPPIIVGRAADAAGIKISTCQLGCFGVKKGE